MCRKSWSGAEEAGEVGVAGKTNLAEWLGWQLGTFPPFAAAGLTRRWVVLHLTD